MTPSVSKLRIRRSAFSVAVVIIVVGGSMQTPASAQPPPTPEPKPIISAGVYPSDPQDKYGLLAGEIENATTKAKSRGFVGGEVVPAADRLIVYWFGDVPAFIADIIRNSGLTVEIRSVPFPLDVLYGQAKRLASEPRVASAGLGQDFRSLKIELRDGTSSAEATRLSQSIPVTVDPDVASRFPSTTAIPVEVSSYTSKGTIALERQTDTPAFWGGATITRPLGSGAYICTTGFSAVLNGGTRRGIVTTDHCGSADWKNSNGLLGVGTQFVGRPFRRAPAADAMFLSYGFSYAPRVYNGPTRSTSSLRVGYWTSPLLNWGMSENGAVSGEVSGVVVTNVGVFQDVEGVVRGPGFWTFWSGDAFGSAGQGDSGAVAHRALYDPNGELRMQITGLISGGDVSYPAPCRGYTSANGVTRACFKRIFHVNIGAVLSQLDITPITS
jgi:hypothetical protein